jgi:hypothetical protein
MKLSENSQLGYEYVALKEGKTAEDLITERAELQGLSYFEDKKRGEMQDLIAKVAKNPLAYKASIEAIAAVEAQKEAAANKELKEV